MTKDEYFKLCTALVQEQVYAWGIASSFVCLGSPPGMADAMLLKPNWSILLNVGLSNLDSARERLHLQAPPSYTKVVQISFTHKLYDVQLYTNVVRYDVRNTV